jgi:hypothetical protein
MSTGWLSGLSGIHAIVYLRAFLDPECDSSGSVSRSPAEVAGYPLSTLILAVPRFVRIQSGHDGQVQTIFEIDKMASALTLDASEN